MRHNTEINKYNEKKYKKIDIILQMKFILIYNKHCIHIRNCIRS